MPKKKIAEKPAKKSGKKKSPAIPVGGSGAISKHFGKSRRALGNPVANSPANPPRNLKIPVDPPSGDLSLTLEQILGDRYHADHFKDQLVFHCVGDTGGIYGPEAQEPVAHAMERQLTSTDPTAVPAFFYHLGDVVYFNGLEHLYGTQFYDPYKHYDAPIVAIPGNHDGDTSTRKGDEPDHDGSLTGFIMNFCKDLSDVAFTSKKKPTKKYVFDKHRDLMNQPYVYWTLNTTFATIIGLYSNVDGTLDSKPGGAQEQWLIKQIKAADDKKWLILALHHPPYSLDDEHGGYPEILNLLERVAAKTRWPDLVLSGHVHNYQRFERTFTHGKTIPFIIAGAGGYANTTKSLHKLQSGIPARSKYITTIPDVTLQYCEEQLPGFLRITVTKDKILSEYFTVPFGSARDGIPSLADQVSIP